jgi:hypothetical protein
MFKRNQLNGINKLPKVPQGGMMELNDWWLGIKKKGTQYVYYST